MRTVPILNKVEITTFWFQETIFFLQLFIFIVKIWSVSFSFNVINSVSFESILPISSLFDKQRHIFIIGVVVEH